MSKRKVFRRKGERKVFYFSKKNLAAAANSNILCWKNKRYDVYDSKLQTSMVESREKFFRFSVSLCRWIMLFLPFPTQSGNSRALLTDVNEHVNFNEFPPNASPVAFPFATSSVGSLFFVSVTFCVHLVES